MADAVPNEAPDVGLVLGPDRALGEPRSLALSAGAPARASFASSKTAADEAPEWVMVLPLGRVEDDPNLVEVRDWRPNFRVSNPEALVEEFNERIERDGPVVIDRNHGELWAWFGQETPAAGWLGELELRDDGIWGRSSWTPRGGREVAELEYGYTSSVVTLKWATNSEGQRDYETPPEVGRIAGLSIVNSPGTYTKWLTALHQQPEAYMAAFGLAPFSRVAAEGLRARAELLGNSHPKKKVVVGSSASRRQLGGAHGGEPAAAVFSTQAGSPGDRSEEPPMSTSSPNLTPAAQTALAQLGLSADASPEAVATAIAQLKAAPSEAIADLSQQINALTLRAEANEAAERERRIELALKGALDSGRLTPGGVETYREIGCNSGPEVLEQALSVLTPAPLDRREGQLELEAEPQRPAAEGEVAAFAVDWGLTPAEMQEALARRDELPQPRLLDPTSVDRGEPVKVGA